jgi:hypothetical protein
VRADELPLLCSPIDGGGGQQGAIGLRCEGAIGSNEFGKDDNQVKAEQQAGSKAGETVLG